MYALMDSQALGAYQFIIHPAATLVMDDGAYPRKEIERMGVAPITSMFQNAENDHRGQRLAPEIHDSDGLALWMALANGSGARWWPRNAACKRFRG